jgi:hypothetical protein
MLFMSNLFQNSCDHSLTLEFMLASFRQIRHFKTQLTLKPIFIYWGLILAKSTQKLHAFL